MVLSARSAHRSSATPHPGGEPSCLVPSGTSSSSTASAPPFGKAGPKGIYHETRADDLVVKAIRELLRRNPGLDPKKIDEVAIAATTQIGDQGLTLGRTAGILAGLPQSVPGYSIDRMCAGALDRRDHHRRFDRLRCLRRRHRRWRRAHGPPPDGRGRRPQPAVREREAGGRVGPVHGHDRGEPARPLPADHKLRADEYAVRSQEKAAKAYANGKIQQDLVPISVRRTNPEGRRGPAGVWSPPTSRCARAPRWRTWRT